LIATNTQKFISNPFSSNQGEIDCKQLESLTFEKFPLARKCIESNVGFYLRGKDVCLTEPLNGLFVWEKESLKNCNMHKWNPTELQSRIFTLEIRKSETLFRFLQLFKCKKL
jgi:hypothetical protein